MTLSREILLQLASMLWLSIAILAGGNSMAEAVAPGNLPQKRSFEIDPELLQVSSATDRKSLTDASKSTQTANFSGIFVLENLFAFAFGIGTSQGEPDFTTLKDRPTIIETAAMVQASDFPASPLSSLEDDTHQLLNLCQTESKVWKAERQSKVADAIQRTLHFYEKHNHLIQDPGASLALSMLEAVDNRRGNSFQKSFPLSQWKSTVCGNLPNEIQNQLCSKFYQTWEPRSASWKPLDTLEELGAKYKDVGNEKEKIWGLLNGQCQGALLLRCEVPYVCERTYLDEVPRSQYLLSHQLLHRILIDQLQCPSTKDVRSDHMFPELCAKMYKESQLIAQLGTPYLLKDIFAENVALCGHLGFTNFFRDDWLDSILSWQSRSRYGCFLEHTDQRKSGVVDTDPPINRLATEAEEADGVHPEELCKAHFTAVGLGALVQYWDFLEDSCK